MVRITEIRNQGMMKIRSEELTDLTLPSPLGDSRDAKQASRDAKVVTTTRK